MACIVGLDVGTRTIGVARADSLLRHAAPHSTVRRKGLKTDIPKLAKLCEALGATTVIVGLPVNPEGNEGRSARLARQVGEALHQATGLPTHYQDESFSTVEATWRLHEAGKNSRKQRPIIDQAAASVILQDWLDATE